MTFKLQHMKSAQGFAAALILDRPPADEPDSAKLVEIAVWFAARARHLVIVGAGDIDPTKWPARLALQSEHELAGAGRARHYSASAFGLTLLPERSGRAAVVAALQDMARKGEGATALSERVAALSGPAPDLVVVTGGRTLLNNAFTWNAAYAEFVFLEASWTAIGLADLARVIEEFAKRDRRFGGVAAHGAT